MYSLFLGEIFLSIMFYKNLSWENNLWNFFNQLYAFKIKQDLFQKAKIYVTYYIFYIWTKNRFPVFEEKTKYLTIIIHIIGYVCLLIHRIISVAKCSKYWSAVLFKDISALRVR